MVKINKKIKVKEAGSLLVALATAVTINSMLPVSSMGMFSC
jgi:hypothetical protein